MIYSGMPLILLSEKNIENCSFEVSKSYVIKWIENYYVYVEIFSDICVVYMGKIVSIIFYFICKILIGMSQQFRSNTKNYTRKNTTLQQSWKLSQVAHVIGTHSYALLHHGESWYSVFWYVIKQFWGSISK